MSPGKPADVMHDLGDSTKSVAAAIGDSATDAVDSARQSAQTALRSVGNRSAVAGTSVAATAAAAGSSVKHGSAAALDTVSNAASGAFGRARSAAGDTVETVIDKAYELSGAGRTQVGDAVGTVADRARRTRSAGSRVVAAKRPSRSALLHLRGVALDARDTALTLARRRTASGADQTEDATRPAVTPSRIERIRAVSAMASDLTDRSSTDGTGTDRDQKRRRGRAGTALKVALLVALAAAVTAAVRALRPSSSGTGASIPPKMHPVPNSRPASSTRETAVSDDGTGPAGFAAAGPASGGADPDVLQVGGDEMGDDETLDGIAGPGAIDDVDQGPFGGGSDALDDDYPFDVARDDLGSDAAIGQDALSDDSADRGLSGLDAGEPDAIDEDELVFTSETSTKPPKPAKPALPADGS